jgi:BMFP domain-containing protein YqiC
MEIHENRVIYDLEQKVEELEQKIKDLEARPMTYTEAHYYADTLRYEARIAELEAQLKKAEK